MPAFALEMEAEAEQFVEENGRVAGVRLAGGRMMRAGKLVIAADGRSSLVRKLAMLPVEQLGAPMDVFWFRLPKADNPGDKLRGAVGTGRMAVMIDRRTYWQAAYLIPKGAAEEVKARGIGWLRGQMQALFPELDLSGGLESTEDLHLLSVALDRLERWHGPGLLAIGDAAHAMSPIGGIGINLAIQDAVAAANALAGPLARGEPADPLLAMVQARREFPTRVIQAGQKLAQDNVIGAVFSGRRSPGRRGRSGCSASAAAAPDLRAHHRPRRAARAGQEPARRSRSAAAVLPADRYAGLQIRWTNDRHDRSLGHDQFDPEGIPVPEIGRLVRLAQCVHAALFRSGGCLGETRQFEYDP